MLTRTDGSIIASNSARCSRTSARQPGAATRMTVSTSLDSASFASTQSRRTWSRADIVVGSAGSRVRSRPSVAVSTKASTASSKSMPPSRSMPSDGAGNSHPPAVRRNRAASNVPPPRS